MNNHHSQHTHTWGVPLFFLLKNYLFLIFNCFYVFNINLSLIFSRTCINLSPIYSNPLVILLISSSWISLSLSLLICFNLVYFQACCRGIIIHQHSVNSFASLLCQILFPYFLFFFPALCHYFGDAQLHNFNRNGMWKMNL